MLELNKIYCGNCLEIMKEIDDKSIDMILCDMPYGITACRWDKIIPLDKLWVQYKRIIKDNGAIVLTAIQPFTSALVMSNIEMFGYEWIWGKSRASNPMLSKKQPMRYHENILIFYKNQSVYNPGMWKGNKSHATKNVNSIINIHGGKESHSKANTSDIKFPKSIINIKSTNNVTNFHPTQKPVALFEYLIKTYTNEGDLVLDNCIGSGTTAIACKKLGRNFIGIEINPDYVEIANKRLANTYRQMELIK